MIKKKQHPFLAWPGAAGARPTLPFLHGSRTADKAGAWRRLQGQGFAGSCQRLACGNKLEQVESETAAQHEAQDPNRGGAFPPAPTGSLCLKN